MKKIYSWKQAQDGTHFYYGTTEIGTAKSIPNAKDHFAMTEEGVICWTRTPNSPSDTMELLFSAAYIPVYTLIPAVQYGGNQIALRDYFDVRNEHEKNAEAEKPTLTYFKGDREPQTNEPWRLVWHRMSIPGATYSENEEISVAMFLPSDQTGGACSWYTENGRTNHVLLWPEQEGPHQVYADERLQDNYSVPMAPQSSFKAMLAFQPVETPRTAWHKLLDTAWKQYYQLKAPVRNYEELWDLGVAYAKQLYTEEADGFKGFSIGYQWYDRWEKRRVQKYEIGWCGQNASLANSLLAHAQLYGDKEAEKMGLNVLDAWIAAAGHHGLIPTHYDDNMYTNGHEKTVDACNLGTAALQYFEAADRAAALGQERPAYSEMARRICDFAARVMSPQGRIGKSWLEKDLSPAVQEGSTGAFLSMALCEAARRTGERQYLDAAVKSCSYYSQELDKNGFTTAGALDIFTIDKESCIPLLKGNLMLYALTKEPVYLENAEKAGWYLSTWQWHYSRKFPRDSLLAQMGYDIFGGTAVSIHGGMDPFALNYVHEIYDLAEYTGKEQWKQRANGIWREGQMCISDGDMIVDGKAPRPRGSQDESVGFTIGSPFAYQPSQWLVAWPTAFRLEALRHILPADGNKFGRVL